MTWIAGIPPWLWKNRLTAACYFIAYAVGLVFCIPGLVSNGLNGIQIVIIILASLVERMMEFVGLHDSVPLTERVALDAAVAIGALLFVIPVWLFRKSREFADSSLNLLTLRAWWIISILVLALMALTRIPIEL